MVTRRAALFTAVALALVSRTFAAEVEPFDPKAFAAAQDAGKPILVHIRASWCPTCKAQAPILAELTKDPKFGSLVVFDVDFDSQKTAVRSFGAHMQSTLIAYKGARETARSVGDTRKASIAKLLDSTL